MDSTEIQKEYENGINAILLAILQIIKRNNHEKRKLPMIGLILNSLWFSAYLVTLYLVFVWKAVPFLI